MGECPCLYWTKERVLGAPKCEGETEKLVQWLSQSQPVGDKCDGKQSWCGGIKCLNRVGASFVILNGVRDGCRMFFSEFTAPTSTVDAAKAKATPAHEAKSSYEDNFPSLGGPSVSKTEQKHMPNVLQARPKNKKVPQQQKRRIRPAPSPSASRATSKALGNISSLPSEDTSKMVHQLNKNTTNKPIKTKTAWTSEPKPNANNASSKLAQNCRKGATKPQHAPKKLSSGPIKPEIETIESKIAKPNFNNASFDLSQTCSTGKTKPQHAPKNLSSAPIKPETATNESQINAQNPSTNNKKQNRIEPPPPQQLEIELARLVRVYHCVCQQQLVPSTILELHLLLRLLSVSSPSSSNTTDTTFSTQRLLRRKLKRQRPKSFDYLLSDLPACNDFAKQVLNLFAPSFIYHLGYETLQALSTCHPLEQSLPHISQTMRQIMEGQSPAMALETPLQHLGGRTTLSNDTRTIHHPLYSLPFDPIRDSRNNYRTAELSAAFTNRENVRDAFLTLLRDFEHDATSLRHAARAASLAKQRQKAILKLVEDLRPCNWPWFAEFFLELLLQRGTTTAVAGDSGLEVLGVDADARRLQKLHERLFTKSSQVNKSTQTLMLEQDHQDTSQTMQPEHYFPGTQAFFFYFITTADSHSLSVHLMQRFCGRIATLTRSTASGRDHPCRTLQMLARFLGVLVFSPQWPLCSGGKEVPAAWNEAFAASNAEATSFLNEMQPVLPFNEYIVQAWTDHGLVRVVPWVVEFLSMIKWDSISQRTSYYKGILGFLREVQLRLKPMTEKESEHLNGNVQMVKLCLEKLFGEIIGLQRTEQLPFVKLPPRKPCDGAEDATEESVAAASPRALDFASAWFSKDFLFTTCPHLEELHKLLAEMRSANRLCVGSGASRKLRPLPVGKEILNEPSLDTTTEIETSVSFSNMCITPSPNDEALPHTAIQEALVRAFFHQHQDLKRIAEFVVDIHVKNTCTLVRDKCVMPVLENHWPSGPRKKDLRLASSDSPVYVKVCEAVENDATERAHVLMKQVCEGPLIAAMESLISGVAPEVRETAIALSTEHALREGTKIMSSLVKLETKKYMEARMAKALQLSKSGTSKGGCDNESDDTCNQKTTATLPLDSKLGTNLDEITALLNKSMDAKLEYEKDLEIQRNILSMCKNTLNEFQATNPEMKSQHCEAAKRLCRALASLLAIWLPSSQLPPVERKRPIFLVPAVSVVIEIARLGLVVPEIRAVGSMINDNLLAFLTLNEEPTSMVETECENETAVILFSLMEVQMINKFKLESAVLLALRYDHSTSSKVAVALLKLLDNKQRAKDMSLLRQELERDQNCPV